MSLPRLLLDDLARLLSEETGLSLHGGLELPLLDGLEAAARLAGEPPRAFARRVLARDRAAIEALVEHAVVSESAFWRHPEQLVALGRLAAAAPGPLAIWSAGCARGEEPYSVAIALLEAGRGGRGDRILATDVSERALAAARAGVYGARALRKLPLDLQERWLEGAAERRVKEAPRALVSFARHNLVGREPEPRPDPGGPFDLVLCRNVLLWFDVATASAVARRLAAALRPGGVLVLGPVEVPLGEAAGLVAIETAGATLLRRPGDVAPPGAR